LSAAVNVFLPARQVDRPPAGDIGAIKSAARIQCIGLQIDESPPQYPSSAAGR